MNRELLEKVYNNTIALIEPQIETGFTDIDELLQCCDKGSLIMIGGACSMGKTVLSKSILLNQLISNKKCMYFDLEWTKEQFIQSLLFMLAEINISKRRILSDMDRDKLKTALNNMLDLRLEIFDCSCYKVEQIIKAIKNNKPEYVFIDPLQEIRTDDNLYIINHILEKLRTCARETGTTIFVTSILEDTVRNNKYQIPTWKDFKNSEAVIEFCDQVLLLYRPSCYYSEEDMPESHEKNKLEIYSAKTIKGFVSYDFNFDTYKIKANI